MAVNQPQIGKDQADNSWKLEVTTQVNSEEARLNDLASRLARLEAGGSNTTSTNTGALRIDNYVQMLVQGTNLYTFTGADANGDIENRSLVFVGGLKLIESVDFEFAGSNQIRLLQSPDVDSNSMIELTVWSLT